MPRVRFPEKYCLVRQDGLGTHFFLGGCASQEQGLASCDALKEIISPLLSKDGKLL